MVPDPMCEPVQRHGNAISVINIPSFDWLILQPGCVSSSYNSLSLAIASVWCVKRGVWSKGISGPMAMWSTEMLNDLVEGLMVNA